MILMNSDVKIGHRVEKLYDIVDCAPFKIVPTQSNDCYEVVTEFDKIVLTGGAQLQQPNGNYIFVERIKPYTTSLKNVSGVAVVKAVNKLPASLNVCHIAGTDYVIVNGYYVASEG